MILALRGPFPTRTSARERFRHDGLFAIRPLMARRFPDHFSPVAAEYASYRPVYPEGLFAWLASLARRRVLAWDCAAGSGQATAGLAPFFDRVVGTDASEAQISAAPAHPKIEYRVARAEASGLTSGTVDLVTVAQALHWLDPDAFYREAERVLVPDGVLAAFTYGDARLDDGPIDRAFQRFRERVVGPHWPPQRRLVETGYRTLPFPFAEIESPSFSMSAGWTLAELLGYVGTWSATARHREATGGDAIRDLAGALGPLWGDPQRLRAVRWPLSLRVGRSAKQGNV